MNFVVLENDRIEKSFAHDDINEKKISVTNY
jgi:hypothetical protein